MSEASSAMLGKTAMVTGATDGIGWVTARELAGMGARVLLVGRNEQKGQRALAGIRKAVPGADLAFHRADLSLMTEVRRLARNVAESEARLDVLVNNAGGLFQHRQETAEGFERTFALNHLNYFLLTNLLLGKLGEAPAARIVNVASRAHEGGRLNFDDLQASRNYKGWPVYRASKLANVLFTRALAEQLKGSGVTANALHPGFVRTAFGGGNPLVFRLAVRAAMLVLAISVEEGAKTSIHLASSSEVEGLSGGYYAKSRLIQPSAAAKDDAAAERLWQVSEAMVARV
jgi:retinol dehydrogenase-12